MKNINDLLGDFKNLKDPKDDKVIIQKILKEVGGLDIPLEKIKFAERTLKLNVSGPERTSLFMKQQRLLEEFKKALPSRPIEKIY